MAFRYLFVIASVVFAIAGCNRSSADRIGAFTAVKDSLADAKSALMRVRTDQRSVNEALFGVVRELVEIQHAPSGTMDDVIRLLDTLEKLIDAAPGFAWVSMADKNTLDGIKSYHSESKPQIVAETNPEIGASFTLYVYGDYAEWCDAKQTYWEEVHELFDEFHAQFGDRLRKIADTGESYCAFANRLVLDNAVANDIGRLTKDAFDARLAIENVEFDCGAQGR